MCQRIFVINFHSLVFFFFLFCSFLLHKLQDKKTPDEIQIAKKTTNLDEFHFSAYDNKLKLGFSATKTSCAFYNLKLLKKAEDFLLFPKRHTAFIATELSHVSEILINLGRIWPRLERGVESAQLILNRLESMHQSPLAIDNLLKSYNEDTQV